MPSVLALRSIKVVISNRVDDALGGKTTKHDMGAVLIYQDGTGTQLHIFAPEIPPGKPKQFQWDVPDAVPVAVHFLWYEQHGAAVGYRAAVFQRDGSSVGLPWNSIFLGFDIENLNGHPYEFSTGGIAVAS